MMLGLAGIGMSFLRLRSPAEVPSVLSLEPPRPRQAARRLSGAHHGEVVDG
jgi:hypothetical protein